MPFFLENYGLADLADSEDAVGGLMRLVARDGNPVVGYYDEPYFNLHLGAVQLILRTERKEGGSGFGVTGIDAHIAGNSIWEAHICEANIDRKDADHLSKRILIRRKDDSGGLAVVNLVNADVLPCFAKNEPIRMQMAAFPAKIDYYSNEDEYADAQPKSEVLNGKPLLLEDGLVVATGLLNNRNPNNPDFGKDDDLDDYVLLRGTVKRLVQGVFELNGEKYHSFIRCIIATEYGDLELLHTIDEVSEDQRANVRVGAIVSAVCVLSGDVAIYEYENGIICDETHDLALLRGVFSGGDPERMRKALAAKAEYLSEYSGVTYTGADSIIDRFKYVQSETKENAPYSAYNSTISRIDGSAAASHEQRAVALSRDNGQSFESVAFIEVDETGKIAKLTVSDSKNYHIQLDAQPQTPRFMDETEMPKSVAEPMLNRARMMGIIDDGLTDDEVVNGGDHTWQFDDSSKKMFESLLHADYSDEILRNAFGYLFAKGIETEYLDQRVMPGNIHFEPADAFAGVLHTDLEPAAEEKIAESMEKGQSFFQDFKFFQEHVEQANIEKNLPLAFFVIQQLGRLYHSKLFE